MSAYRDHLADIAQAELEERCSAVKAITQSVALDMLLENGFNADDMPDLFTELASDWQQTIQESIAKGDSDEDIQR